LLASGHERENKRGRKKKSNLHIAAMNNDAHTISLKTSPLDSFGDTTFIYSWLPEEGACAA